MKIYFSGSIRGGRQDAELYGQIIKLLSTYGTVLTEHIGDSTLTAHGNQEGPEEAIYQKDMAWLTEADVIVAEITTPSLGVGYELAKVEDMQKPVLCLYRPSPDRKPSAMIAGNGYFTVKSYTEPGEVPVLLEEFFASTLIAAR